MNDQASYFHMMNANGIAHVYHQALACGVFDALLKEPLAQLTLEQLCDRCQIAPRPTALLLDVLVQLSLVSHRDNHFAETPLLRLLLSGSYRTLGDPFWNHLPAFLKTAQPIVEMDNPAHSEKHYAAQAGPLAWMSAPAAHAAAQLLSANDSLQGAHILDIGAGSAIWSLSLAQIVPDLTITAIDWPMVLDAARKRAGQFGLQDRLTLLPGNYHSTPLPENAFDLAIVANVLHLEPAERCESLIRKIQAALKPEGRIAIIDIFPPMDGSGGASPNATRTSEPLTAALYAAAGLALRTRSAKIHRFADIAKMLAACDFDFVERTHLEAPPDAFEVITARKTTVRIAFSQPL